MKLWAVMLTVTGAVEVIINNEVVELSWTPEAPCAEKFASALTALEKFGELIGQGCRNTACSAVVLTEGLAPECARFASSKLADIQLLGDDTDFDPRYADIGAALQFELAHHEAGIPAPKYVEALRTRGWDRMPGRWPTMFPKSWVDRVQHPEKKRHRFTFVGGLKNDKSTELMRRWVIDFALTHFDDTSYLAFTDPLTHQDPLGPFDRTLEQEDRWNPKLRNPPTTTAALMTSEDRKIWMDHLLQPQNATTPAFLDVITSRFVKFDPSYFDTLCASEMALAPAGDGPWSRRFFEAVLCCAIPIVQRPEHSGRTDDERQLGYHFYVYDPTSSDYRYREDWANANLQLLLRTATLLNPGSFAFRWPRPIDS